MKAKNPFEVLGIDPRLVLQLSAHQLDQIIGVTGRTLKAMFHPDQVLGGDIDRFIEINTACQVLNRTRNPQGFEEARKSLLEKLKRSKVLSLSLELEKERIERNKTSEAFVDFLMKTGVASSEVPLVSKPSGWRVKMLDKVMMVNIPDGYKARGDGFFYLDFTPVGNFRVSSKEKSQREYHRIPIGTIAIEAFQKCGGLNRFLSQNTIPLPRRVVSRGDTRIVTRRGSGPVNFISREQSHIMDTIRYEVPSERMAYMARYLSQDMCKDRVLFSITNGISNPAFYAEGLILGVQPLT